MFERFTDRARRVLVLAQEEARLLNHSFIGTEHILLGLINEGDGLAAKALESLEISLNAVRDMVAATIGPSASALTGSPPFTPRAKKVLELSLREALQLGHNYIGTEHILLGLVREGEGVGAQVLQNLGADLPLLRREVIQLLSGYKERIAGRPEGASGVRPAPWCTQCGESLEGNLRVREITASGGEHGTPKTFAIAYCGTCGAAIGSRAQDAPVGVLEGLQPVRLRPAMFVGSTSADGLHRLVSEAFDNALNEAAQGFCTRIEVTLRADGGCRVADDGRGIPVAPHPNDPTRSAAEIVLTVLHAEGKFSSSEEKMIGGAGIAVVNALSSRFELQIDREGFHHAMVFVDGGRPAGPLKVEGPSSRTGTTITFWPDATIFDEVEFGTDDVVAYLRAVSSTYPDVGIFFRDERPGSEQEITLGLDPGLE